MNYKDKKYLSEDKWLIKKLSTCKVFLIAQLKSCNADEWIKFQKELKKLNLKVKLISFKNLKDASFFSKLDPILIQNLFKGNIVLIYSDEEILSWSNLVISLKTLSLLRLLLIYTSGRFLDINSKDTLRNIESVRVSEWYDMLNTLDVSIVYHALNSFKSSPLRLLEFQHIMILNILQEKIKNDEKF